ncbi:AraC-type DNA-binding protein [Streptosporangium subroseum]|uniref:AraC-type DNA-binding protein n=1 Tax=Streptosporangium subroseum TaxID=106412 RepID=A0A239PCV9_9ACTN|nr:AraC family transcriptional regulator [Streptosporangium subroseum]SNT64906.1 AraC-type DNA-binding protein [Streptosporangium subroseum]
MLEKVFDSEELPQADRLDAWHDSVSHWLTPNVFTVDQPAEFRASLQAADLGPAQVVTMTYSSMRTSRTPKMIRRSDPEMYVVGLTLWGRQAIAQAGRDTALGECDLVLYSTFQPFETQVRADDGTAGSVVAHIPRALLLLPSDKVDRLLATRLPGRTGMGALFSQFLTHLATGDGDYGPDDDIRLGTVTLDLFTALLAHHLDAGAQVPVDSRERVLITQIRAFISRHLGDQRLSPETVASAHHISLRYLQRLFQQNGHTVSAWIRDQRLEHARRDLADPASFLSPIQAIAIRWGFAHPAAFSRAFRAAYGMSPRDYRHHFHPDGCARR